MVAPNEMDGLRAAWRALAGGGDQDGWHTIPVTVRAPCTLFAGRRMPGGEEAVLIGFRNIRHVAESSLPQGHGFEVLRLKADPTGVGGLMLALARRTGGSTELFVMMAEDLVSLINGYELTEEESVLRRFLARIRAWQDFMDRHKETVLSPEAELGLFGELMLLEHMVEAGVAAREILDAWQGPLGGLHDFVISSGAIEVKATLSKTGFPATVSSLEQLDESLRHPLFAAAIRLALHPTGRTLPEMADVIRGRFINNQSALETFEIRLMQAGFLRTASEEYTRRFLWESTAMLAVQGDFPRLTRANVHPAIRKARYEVDLDSAGAEDVGLEQALQFLGVA